MAGQGRIIALLGPTNTGKTHAAVERMLALGSGMIGLPLRLLAREVYERVAAARGAAQVALVTGEEKRIPAQPRFWVCTTESMPVDRPVAFVAVDEVQLAGDRHRGHVFTDRILRARGVGETWFLGADTIGPLLQALVPTVELRRQERLSTLRFAGHRKLHGLPPRSAIVAFSMERVFAIAERVRARHGGAAVV
ncbi:MAG TPA: helicase, partial [Myxococcota bacterium]|nr:helicase [Myxococcota bacterium]